MKKFYFLVLITFFAGCFSNSWTNPITQKKIDLKTGWKNSPHPTLESQNSYNFSNSKNEDRNAVLIFKKDQTVKDLDSFRKEIEEVTETRSAAVQEVKIENHSFLFFHQKLMHLNRSFSSQYFAWETSEGLWIVNGAFSQGDLEGEESLQDLLVSFRSST